MSNRAFGIIFSNMHDKSLREFTEKRTMGSVPFGGRYRLIDFALSNMCNSGISKVGVVTKSNYQSLMDHIGSGKDWDLSRKRDGLFILPPFGHAQSGVYKGRLDALIGIREFIHHCQYDYVIMSDCDNICNINFREALDYHIKNGAEITAICKKIAITGSEIDPINAYTTDSNNRVTEIILDPPNPGEYDVGLNMWIANKKFLENTLDDAKSRSYESWRHDILQRGCGSRRIFVWNFDGYVGHINSISSYFRANMDLLNSPIRDELFFKHGHVYTKVRDDVPTKYYKTAHVANSLIADGCNIEGEVENSVLFRGVTVGKGVKISNSIIMQGTQINSNVKLNYVIIDKDVVVKDNRMLMGFDTYPVYIAKGSVV